MQKILIIISVFLLASCSFFQKNEGEIILDELPATPTNTETPVVETPIPTETVSENQVSTGETLTNIDVTATQAKNISDMTYDILIANGCNLGMFVFEEEKLPDYLVGITFNDLLMLRSKTQWEFKCFKLEKTIVGTNVGIIDDYGEERTIQDAKLNEQDKIVVPKQAGILDFLKTRRFIAVEQKLGLIFEWFIYPEQLKKEKISSLWIVLFRKTSWELIGYELSKQGTIIPSKIASNLIECMKSSKVLTDILDDKSTVLEGIFRELEWKVDVTGTVMEYPRFYHSFITHYYTNDLKNHPERFENECISIYK